MRTDAAHLHLMLTHLPVIGGPFLLLLLSIGLARRSTDVVTVALVLTVGLAITTGGVYLTGEPAEEALESTPWFQDSLTDAHEDRAAAALVSTLATGVLAVMALVPRPGQPSASAPRVVRSPPIHPRTWLDRMVGRPDPPR